MIKPNRPKDLDTIFEALANQHRREIIYVLGLQPHSISQLASQRGLSLPAIHKHIKILENAGMIIQKKIGRTHFLTLNRKSLLGLQDWLMQYHAYWGNDEETLENYTKGYSKKSLVEKLGIKEGLKVAILNSPANYNYTLGKLPENVTVMKNLGERLDFIQFFTKESKELQGKFPALKRALSQKGVLWISWPKGSSKVKTDLNENMVREIGLNNCLVDVKIAAVDEIWSGLKFVYRLKDREIKRI